MLDWLVELAQTSPVGHAVGLIALVCALGMASTRLGASGIKKSGEMDSADTSEVQF